MKKENHDDLIPTVASLHTFLLKTFYDPRDFEGFVMDNYPAVWRNLPNYRYKSRSHVVSYFLEAVDRVDIWKTLKKIEPLLSDMEENYHLLDFEDIKPKPERRVYSNPWMRAGDQEDDF